MRLFEAVAVIMVGVFAFAFVIGRTRAGDMPRIRENRWDDLAKIGSPLVVAAVVVIGLVLLVAENRTGGVVAHQLQPEHSSAIQNLFFGH